MLPNFLVIGAQKAGTTSLFEYLRQHPDIYLPQAKETAFFYHDYKYEKGLSYYEEHYFGSVNGEKAVGEVSPHYLYHTFCRDRIRENLRDLKFIILLRNPIDRAYSNYWMEVKRGLETLSFEDAIEKEQMRIEGDLFERETFSYMHRGLYYGQIKAYMDLFPEANFLCLLSDDLKYDRVNALKNIFMFLGVSTEENLQTLQKTFHTATKIRSLWLQDFLRNPSYLSRLFIKSLIPFKLRRIVVRALLKRNVKSFTPPPMSDSVREYLREYFLESNEKLEKLISREFIRNCFFRSDLILTERLVCQQCFFMFSWL